MAQSKEQKHYSKMISSNEILTLINALGLDPKAQEIDLKDLRYGKIIIMTDADVDGSHIRALLLKKVNSKALMCEPSTSASVIIIIFPYLKSFKSIS